MYIHLQFNLFDPSLTSQKIIHKKTLELLACAIEVKHKQHARATPH